MPPSDASPEVSTDAPDATMESGSADPASRQPGAPRKAGRSGVVVQRKPFLAWVNRLRKRSPLNPYWLSRLHLQRSMEELAPHSSGQLLDVGVAERPYGELFDPYVTRYVGLDYPPVLHDKMPEFWELLETMRQSMDVFGDGHYLPFREASFDTVLATEVLEHVPDPDRCVSEMVRVLRPGGRLLLTVPFVEPLHFLPGDYVRLTPTAIQAMMARAGVEIEELVPRGNFSVAVGATMAQWLLRTFAAKERQIDGSVLTSPIRLALVSPFLAASQLFFHFASKLWRDDMMPLGYRVVARKPGA